MVPTAFSCASCSTRSTPCLSVFWMPWWPTSCPSAVKSVSFLCCGIRVYSPWLSATRLTWGLNRRKHCWSCSRYKHTHRSLQRSAGSCRTRSRGTLKSGSLLQWKWTDLVRFSSLVMFPQREKKILDFQYSSCHGIKEFGKISVLEFAHLEMHITSDTANVISYRHAQAFSLQMQRSGHVAFLFI